MRRSVGRTCWRPRRRWPRTAGIPNRNLKLVNRQATYAHNDPSAAEPKVNAFFKRLIPFLSKISAGKEAKAKKK